MSSSRKVREPSRAVSAALRYAGRRVRSQQELISYLRRRAETPGAVRQALEACRAAGVVDDRAAARLWAETWARQGYSAAAIHSRLEARGFASAIAGKAIERLALASGDAARAAAMVAGRRRSGRRKDERLRAARRLAGRGFDTEVIEQVLDMAFGPPSG